jgi:hypothetical protein
MKKLFVMFFSAVALISCSNATDGDAKTDTTTMPIDTGGLNDTSNHVNSNTSGYPTDTAGARTDVRSSNPTDAGSRSTTQSKDSVNKKY